VSAGTVLRASAVVFVAAMLQTVIVSSLVVGGGAPDLLLVVVISVGLIRGSVPGAVFGFFGGVVVDLEFVVRGVGHAGPGEHDRVRVPHRAVGDPEQGWGREQPDQRVAVLVHRRESGLDRTRPTCLSIRQSSQEFQPLSSVD